VQYSSFGQKQAGRSASVDADIRKKGDFSMPESAFEVIFSHFRHVAAPEHLSA
jgi:hypothetical protein